MEMPRNTDLPFFSYGIFKPGQLAFHQIKDLVSTAENGIFPGSFLRERDGIPLLCKEPNSSGVKGVLLFFRPGLEHEAYDRIVKMEPDNLYYWSDNEVRLADGRGRVKTNVFIGTSPDKGSVDIEDQDQWDGRRDPYFTAAFEEIEEQLIGSKSFNIGNLALLFRLQMAYFLLWSSIERYASFRYHLGGNPTKKVLKIAEDPAFSAALKEVVSSRRRVYRTSNLDSARLDPNDPKKSLEYYYQVRSNSAHRGKASLPDFEIMRDSVTELFAIFKQVLENAFRSSKSGE